MAAIELKHHQDNAVQGAPQTPNKTKASKLETEATGLSPDASPAAAKDKMAQSCITIGLHQVELDAEDRRMLVDWLAQIRASDTVDSLANFGINKLILKGDLDALDPPKPQWYKAVSAMIDQAECSARARDYTYATQAIQERSHENHHGPSPLTTAVLPGLAPHIRNTPKATERWHLKDVQYPSDVLVKMPVTHPLLARLFQLVMNASPFTGKSYLCWSMERTKDYFISWCKQYEKQNPVNVKARLKR